MMQPGDQSEIDVAHDASREDVRARATGLIQDGRMEDAAMLLANGRRLFPDDVHLVLEQASLAETLGDQDGAIELLEMAIDRFPATPAAYLRAGTLCRKIDRPREAEMILLEGMCWFPSNTDMFADYAAIAEDRQDWMGAARRYRLARERFPSHVWPHARLAAALRRAKRPLEAEQALLHGQQHVPHDAHFPLEYAELAAECQDWTEAARRFEAARERFRNSWWACKRHADVLKRAGRMAEAEAVLLEGQAIAPNEPALFLDHAELAADRQDWPETLRRFEAVRERFPGEWWPYKRIADLLTATSRTDEAETVLLDAQRRHPQQPALFFEHAELAAAAKDWTETLRRFEVVCERFPGEWWPYKRIADVLTATSRIDEAEAVLLDAQRRYPQEAALFFDHAELAAAAKDWTETLRRFEAVRDRFPNLWGAYRRIAQTLREMDRFDEAERVIVEAMELFPDDPAMFFDHADLNQRMNRLEEAIERYRFIRQRFPDTFWGHLLLARSLIEAKRLDEAESVLIETMEIFPEGSVTLVELVHLTGRIPAEVRQVSLSALEGMVSACILRYGETVDLLGARAHLARLNGDYHDYMRQLVHLAERHPDATDVAMSISVAREILLGRGEPVPDESVVLPAEPSDVPRTPRELICFFESLGGSGPRGCEFGFLQRELKIEPLSLLRWTGVTLPNLTRLLVNDFKDVGNPETTVLTSVDRYFDWHVVDTIYDLRCDHSHLDRLTVPMEQAREMMCQRTTFLARKLREDLEDGTKIFVFRHLDQLDDEAAMLALADAMNGFGKTMLLFVCRADGHYPPLTVRLVHPGLMVGYIDWFSTDRAGFPVNVDGWVTLCSAAYRLWRSPGAPA